MKTKKTVTNTGEKSFDTVAFFSKVKEQIAKQLEGKSFEEQRKLLDKFLSGELQLSSSSPSVVSEPKVPYGKKKK